MADHKKHHYVPQFYLRNFSLDAKVVSTYNLAHEKIFISKIRNICQENYFYGDEELELILGKIEGEQANILKKLLSNFSFYSLDTREQFYWFQFILMQLTRTKGSANFTDGLISFFYDEAIKPVLKTNPEMKEKGVTSDFLDSITLKMEKSHLLPMSKAMMGVELIADLFPIFLINKTDNMFVTSDDLICLYNYVKLKKHGTLGLQSPGLQIYCPLNEEIVFLLIDREFYHIDLDEERDGSGIIYINKSSDIDAINKLQILNCEQNIICLSQTNEEYIRKIHYEVKTLLREKQVGSTKMTSFTTEDGNHHEIINTYRMPTNYKLRISFLRLNHEINKMWKGKIKRMGKVGECPVLCRDPKAYEIVDKRINEKYQLRLSQK